MNKEELLNRVKQLRAKIDLADAYVCRFLETDVDSESYFIIWDDENLILYAISENTEIFSQGQFPLKIRYFDYKSLETIFSLHKDI